MMCDVDNNYHLESLIAENEKLKEENQFLELINSKANANLMELVSEYRELSNKFKEAKYKLERAVSCIYEIEDALNRGNDNDWVRNAITEWENEEGKM